MKILVLLIVLLTLCCCYIVKHKQNVEEFNEYKNSIPKKVHQVYLQGYDNIPDCAKEVIKKNKYDNPEYEFHLYDLNAINDYIATNTTETIQNAYRLLNTNCKACIADFFRYVIIYNEGGIYADIKVRFITKLDKWINNSNKIKLSLWPWTIHSHLNKFYPKEFKVKSDNREINQSVLLYPPRHKILEEVIYEMVDTINRKHENPNENQSVLSITGPHLYTKVIAPKLNNEEFDLSFHPDTLFDGNIEYDGTNGCYHNSLKKNNLKWGQLKEKIVL